MNDPINHPTHYTSHPSGIEPITITKHMNFCLGNVIKYVMRADYKGNRLDDLKKAQYYLNLEISSTEGKNERTIRILREAGEEGEKNAKAFRELNYSIPNIDIITWRGSFPPTDEEIKKYAEEKKAAIEEREERESAKARINAQYKPENWDWGNKKKCPIEQERRSGWWKRKLENVKLKDTSDPSGEPFLTDLCKTIDKLS